MKQKYMQDDIRDDEVRMLGTENPLEKRRRRLIRWIVLSAAALIGIGLILFLSRPVVQEDVTGLFESANEEAAAALGNASAAIPYTERLDTLADGRPLVLYIPHNATPRLSVGHPDETLRSSAILAFQAADIRADNGEILGDFVLSGEKRSRGTAKKGFCAILDGEISVGVSDSTPLLASALSGKGYFFRQYPLVDDGLPVDNKPKGKAIRRALCVRGGQVFVAVSGAGESFPDFARMLVSLGVDQAIYLVGGKDAFGWAVGMDGSREQFGADVLRPECENESYILWE